MYRFNRSHESQNKFDEFINENRHKRHPGRRGREKTGPRNHDPPQEPPPRCASLRLPLADVSMAQSSSLTLCLLDSGGFVLEVQVLVHGPGLTGDGILPSFSTHIRSEDL